MSLARLVEGSRVLMHEVFAEGWLQGESAWGRPVELEVMPDGSLLVSDDHAGAIYRIAYLCFHILFLDGVYVKASRRRVSPVPARERPLCSNCCATK